MQLSSRNQQHHYFVRLAELRARQWAASAGDEAPRAAGVYAMDATELPASEYARRFGTPIDMLQIFRAIKREFEKEGKFFYPDQFSQYYELAKSV
jgi:hypothetical protein